MSNSRRGIPLQQAKSEGLRFSRAAQFLVSAVCMLVLINGCATSTRVSLYKSVESDGALVNDGALWMGTRSAAVQSAEQYQQLFSTLENAFRQAGFDLVEDKSEARYQAYFWFGKRRERREQFSNVTDGMNITTEYTWAMTLEILSKEEWGLGERYSAEVEMAIWCPSIDSVVVHLADQLVADFPAANSYEDLELVQIFPSDC